MFIPLLFFVIAPLTQVGLTKFAVLEPVAKTLDCQGCPDCLPLSNASNRDTVQAVEQVVKHKHASYARPCAYPAAPLDSCMWKRLFSGDEVGREDMFGELSVKAGGSHQRQRPAHTRREQQVHDCLFVRERLKQRWRRSDNRPVRSASGAIALFCEAHTWSPTDQHTALCAQPSLLLCSIFPDQYTLHVDLLAQAPSL